MYRTGHACRVGLTCSCPAGSYNDVPTHAIAGVDRHTSGPCGDVAGPGRPGQSAPARPQRSALPRATNGLLVRGVHAPAPAPRYQPNGGGAPLPTPVVRAGYPRRPRQERHSDSARLCTRERTPRSSSLSGWVDRRWCRARRCAALLIRRSRGSTAPRPRDPHGDCRHPISPARWCDRVVIRRDYRAER